MSLKNDLARSANGLAAGGGVDPYWLARNFPDLWAGYCREYHRTSLALAVQFTVTQQTGDNWLGGVTRPTGDKVVCDIITFPGRLERYVRAAMGERAA